MAGTTHGLSSTAEAFTSTKRVSCKGYNGP
jgi:hypothetical protein